MAPCSVTHDLRIAEPREAGAATLTRSQTVDLSLLVALFSPMGESLGLGWCASAIWAAAFEGEK